MTTPTKDIDENAPRIADPRELAAHLEAGCKPKSAFRIGAEHEKFGYCRDSLGPLPYDGERSVKAILEGLRDRFGWDPVIESGHIIGLKHQGASVSLEPGGQFELSGAPLKSIHETCNEVGAHLSAVKTLADEIGVGFLGLGAAPTWSLEDAPMMPKARYQIMRRYMGEVGRLGRQMMFRTATVQVNLDFASEADMVKKLRVSLALQPIATALFANSPFMDGRPNGYQSYRSHIWTDTDPDRSGMLPFVFEDGFGFEAYADYALDVPMYFVRRRGAYQDYAGASFRDFLDGSLQGLEGERPTIDDWNDHLSTIFPEVRMKQFLEMRGADAGPWDMICALPAFWVGLLYDETSLDAAWDLVKGWSGADREALRRAVPAMGLEAPIAGRNVRAIAEDALAIARSGLGRRAVLNTAGDNETGFLGHLDEIVRSGRSLAQVALADWHGVWNKDWRKAFEALSF